MCSRWQVICNFYKTSEPQEKVFCLSASLWENRIKEQTRVRHAARRDEHILRNGVVKANTVRPRHVHNINSSIQQQYFWRNYPSSSSTTDLTPRTSKRGTLSIYIYAQPTRSIEHKYHYVQRGDIVNIITSSGFVRRQGQKSSPYQPRCHPVHQITTRQQNRLVNHIGCTEGTDTKSQDSTAEKRITNKTYLPNPARASGEPSRWCSLVEESKPSVTPKRR